MSEDANSGGLPTKTPEQERVFVRSARGDGTGIISMPADMQEEAHEIVIDYWTDWALAYLWQCGHHRDELEHVAPSLRAVLEQWWDARNSFDKPGEDPQFFDQGKHWNVFWKPSTASIDGPYSERARVIWRDGHEQGWDDCLHAREEHDKLEKPNLCDRLTGMFRRKRK